MSQDLDIFSFYADTLNSFLGAGFDSRWR